VESEKWRVKKEMGKLISPRFQPGEWEREYEINNPGKAGFLTALHRGKEKGISDK